MSVHQLDEYYIQIHSGDITSKTMIEIGNIIDDCGGEFEGWDHYSGEITVDCFYSEMNANDCNERIIALLNKE